NVSAKISRIWTWVSGAICRSPSRIPRAALLCPSPNPAVRMRIFFTAGLGAGSLMDNCERQSTVARNEHAPAHRAGDAESDLGDSDGQYHRSGGAVGLPISLYPRPRPALSLASARIIRYRPRETASHFCRLKRISAAGSQSTGYSRFRSGQRRCHRLERVNRKRWHRRWDLSWDDVYQHDLARPQSNTWRGGGSTLVVEVHHFFSVAVLVRDHNFDLLQRRRLRRNVGRDRGSKFPAEDSSPGMGRGLKSALYRGRPGRTRSRALPDHTRKLSDRAAGVTGRDSVFTRLAVRDEIVSALRCEVRSLQSNLSRAGIDHHAADLDVSDLFAAAAGREVERHSASRTRAGGRKSRA